MRHSPGHVVLALALVAAASPAAAQPASPSDPLPTCEWCGAAEAPRGVGPAVTIAGAAEPGERLIVTGTVLQADGRTPAAGVLIYAYHTNAAGVYPKRGDERGNARRHGYLRGWMRTGADGRYRIETIRPGTYPSRADPAHIHLTVVPPGAAEQSVDDVVFEDDPLVTPAYRARVRERGGSGIVRATRTAGDTLRAVRDIHLGRLAGG